MLKKPWILQSRNFMLLFSGRNWKLKHRGSPSFLSQGHSTHPTLFLCTACPWPPVKLCAHAHTYAHTRAHRHTLSATLLNHLRSTVAYFTFPTRLIIPGSTISILLLSSTGYTVAPALCDMFIKAGTSTCLLLFRGLVLCLTHSRHWLKKGGKEENGGREGRKEKFYSVININCLNISHYLVSFLIFVLIPVSQGEQESQK